MPGRRTRTVAVLLAAAFAALSLGNAYAAGNVTLRLENADIQELVRWGAEHTGKNIILHPQVKGQVTVLAGAPLKPEDAYAVFLSILEVHGFAVVETGEAVKVLPAAIATQQYSRLNAPDAGAHRDALDARVVSLVHLSGQEAEPLLKPLLTASAWLKAIPNTRLLLVADRAGTLERTLGLIREVDRPSPYEVRVIPLRHGRAAILGEHIKALLPQLFSRNSANQLSIRADERTNALLFSGPPLHVAQAFTLIERLDQPDEQDSVTHVVPVHYLDAGELIEPLTQLAASLEPVSRGGDPDGRVKILKNDTHNVLIITAPEGVHRQMADLLAQLDVSRAQVLVEAAIVELSADTALNLGVEWRGAWEEEGVVISGNTLGELPVPDAPDFGGGFTYGYFYDDDFWFVVRALAGATDSNLLSTPTIVVLDNQPAEILVGENVPFVTGASTSASSPTTNPFQTIERNDIGIGLKILPRVNNNNTITLEIEQTVEQISHTNAAATVDIVTNKREIKTTVLIEDGEILVLGGLIRDDVSELRSKVPILGDIPLLGYAFRSTREQHTKRNLMVFIHLRILRRRGEADVVTEHYLDRLDSLRGGKRLLFPSLEALPVPVAPEAEEPEAAPEAAASELDTIPVTVESVPKAAQVTVDSEPEAAPVTVRSGLESDPEALAAGSDAG